MCTECFTFTQCTKTYHVSILAGGTESFGTGFGTSPFSDSCAFGAFWAFGIFVQIPDCPAPRVFLEFWAVRNFHVISWQFGISHFGSRAPGAARESRGET